MCMNVFIHMFECVYIFINTYIRMIYIYMYIYAQMYIFVHMYIYLLYIYMGIGEVLERIDATWCV